MKVFFSKGVQPNKIQLFSKMSIILEEKKVECIHVIFNDIEKYLYTKYKIKTIDIRKKIKEISKVNYHVFFSKLEISKMIQFEEAYNLKTFGKANKKKLIEITKKYLDILKLLDVDEKIDVFILWNNNFLFDRIAYFYAKKNKKKVYIMEQGYFRPFTLSFDSKGVNNESSIPRNKEFFENIVIDTELMENFLDKPLKAKKDKRIVYSTKIYNFFILKNRIIKLLFGAKYDPNFISKKLNIQKMFVKKRLELLEEIDFSVNKDYIFVPFQVETDSQLILNSPNIKSMEHLVKEVIKSVKEYNETYKKTYKVVFKTHPKDFNVDIAKISKEIKKNKISSIFEKGDTEEFIKNSRLVITINSTVGIEALRKGKPVISLGDAFYNIEGIVEHCKNLNDLTECINSTLSNDKNIKLINKFLYYLRFNYFKEIFWENATMNSIRKIVREII